MKYKILICGIVSLRQVHNEKPELVAVDFTCLCIRDTKTVHKSTLFRKQIKIKNTNMYHSYGFIIILPLFQGIENPAQVLQ